MTRVDDLIATAQAEIGKPYTYGAEGPNTFDCSGLISFVFGKLGISLPHNAAEQQQATTRVSNPLPGDLVFFGDPAYHVGLYVGAGQMISAPHSGATVHLTSVGQATNYGRVNGLGTATAPIVGTVQTGLSIAAGTVSSWLGGARNIILEAVVAGLGVGLVGYGLWRSVGPSIKNKLNPEEIL